MTETIIIHDTNDEVIINDDAQAVISLNERIEVVTLGVQGDKGEAGMDSGEQPASSFSFNEPTPKVLKTLTAGRLISEINLSIRVPFDGSGASLAIGTASAPGELVASNENDPSRLLQFEFSPDVQYPAGTEIILTINPGTGATQGSGVVEFQMLP